MQPDLIQAMAEIVGLKGIHLNPFKVIGYSGLGLAGYSSYQLFKNRYLIKMLDYLNQDIYEPKDLTKHVWISGVQGSGKSNKLRRIFCNTFIKQGWGGIYFDTHGTADEILKSIPKNRQDDVVYFAPWMKRVYGINMLQRYSNDTGEIDRIAEDVVQVFHKMYPRSWGEKLAQSIRFATKAVLIAEENSEQFRNPTLIEVHKVLVDENYRNYLFNYVDNEIITNFLANIKATSAVYKLENPLSSENILLFLCQTNGINILRCMEERKIIICNFDKDKLSENANLMAGVLISIITQCAAKRKGDASPEKHPYFGIAADEFYEYANKHINVLIEQMRKKNICVMLANQNRDQIPGVAQSAVAMCQNKFIHTIADEDINWVSSLYKKWFTKEQLVNIPFFSCIVDKHETGRGRNPKIKMQPPYIPLYDWEHAREIKYYSLGRAKNREELLKQIKNRQVNYPKSDDTNISFGGEIIFDA